MVSVCVAIDSLLPARILAGDGPKIKQKCFVSFDFQTNGLEESPPQAERELKEFEATRPNPGPVAQCSTPQTGRILNGKLEKWLKKSQRAKS
jgi:hypothetical protein